MTDQQGQQRHISKIIACDVVPLEAVADERVQVFAVISLIRTGLPAFSINKLTLFFHLAAIVSSQAEEDFDLGNADQF